MVVHDAGGPTGFLAATVRPERFRALVISNTFGWPLAGYPAVRRMLQVVGSRPFGAADSLANVVARFAASRYGAGRRMSKADRRAFLGPWLSRGSRLATRQALAALLRIDPVMATVEQSLQTRLAGVPVLTLFGRKNDPYGWQARFGRIFPAPPPSAYPMDTTSRSTTTRTPTVPRSPAGGRRKPRQPTAHPQSLRESVRI